jgi:replicative DNA helicase
MDNRKSRFEQRKALISVNGKIPPQALELEEAVLGALLQDKECMMDIAEFLKPEAFYHEAHKMIFQAIQKLYIDSEPIDILTVSSALRDMGQLEMVGGNYYIVNLTHGVISGANIEKHARIIQEKFIRRELIRSSSEIISGAYTDEQDIFDLISKSSLEKDNFMQSITMRKEVTNEDLFKETLTQIDNAQHSNTGLTGVPSGFKRVDEVIGGWQKTDLIIIAARPGMGKTSFVLQNALNASIDHNIPGAFFSLEMSNIQLMKKQIAIVADIPLAKFRKNDLQPWDFQAINQITPKITNAPIHWDDTPGMNIVELCAKARRLKARHGIQYIIIDYMQLITGNANNREQEIGQISRSLKGLAKELEIPVIALSQLSRAVESRAGNNKRPMLSDLRESGSIEQDADIVIFIYRPEYYGIEEDEEGNSTAGIAEILIAKHRNGETDGIALNFKGITTGFSDIEETYFNNNPIEPSDEPKTVIMKPSIMFDNNIDPPF